MSEQTWRGYFGQIHPGGEVFPERSKGDGGESWAQASGGDMVREEGLCDSAVGEEVK